MDIEEANAIERTIYEERQELGGNFRELQDQARQWTDWRRYYRNHPGTVLAVGVAGGMALALATSGAGAADFAREPWVGEPARAGETVASKARLGFRGLKQMSQNTRAGRQVSATVQGILDALVGVASAKAIEVVSELVPGFRDHFDAGRRGHPGAGER